MAGFGQNMNILVPNINQCGQKDLSFKVRHKADAPRYLALKKHCFNSVTKILIVHLD